MRSDKDFWMLGGAALKKRKEKCILAYFSGYHQLLQIVVSQVWTWAKPTAEGCETEADSDLSQFTSLLPEIGGKLFKPIRFSISSSIK